ncbi:hypothetical protein OAN03_03535 [Opitutales bacterium]|nr:hypothetical protein [Opitutales bacterium]
MIDAQTLMEQASKTAQGWYMDVCPPSKQEDLEKEPIIIAAKIIAAGLDELAMSNRMIAETLNRKSEE